MRINIKILYPYIILLLAITNSSCIIFDSREDYTDNYTETYPVTFTISTRSADDIYASDDELMKSLLIYVVNSNDNKIEKIIDINFSVLTEEHKVDVLLATGNKKIYVFSNLQISQKTDIGISGLVEGNTMPDMSTADCTLNNGFTLNPVGNIFLPMSNQTSINVLKMSGQSFNLELIRMMCKVKLSIKNETGLRLLLKQLDFSPLTTSSIYALPSNTQGAPSFPVAVTQNTFIYAFSPQPLLDNNASTEYTFYLNESAVNNDGWFKIKLKTEFEGSGEEDIRMSLTNLNYLNRNDYLPLNAVLSNYKLDISVKSYPPIGGYASAVNTGSNEYYCAFSGGGPFLITPTLTRLSDNVKIDLSDSDISFTYTDASPGLFNTPPSIKEGQIIGTLKSSGAGKALLNINITLPPTGGVSRILSYKLYISLN